MIRQLRIRGWIAAAALLVDLLVLGAQIMASNESAACVERLNRTFEMGLCSSPPDLWQILATGAVAIGLAFLIGVELDAARSRDRDRRG